MSDVTGVIVVSFLGVLGSAVFFYTSKIANDAGVQVLTGLVDGKLISTEQRRHILYDIHVPYGAGAMALGVFLAASQLSIAAKIDDVDIKRLAYLAAFLSGWGALSWLVQGTQFVLRLRSEVRQAEAD